MKSASGSGSSTSCSRGGERGARLMSRHPEVLARRDEPRRMSGIRAVALRGSLRSHLRVTRFPNGAMKEALRDRRKQSLGGAARRRRGQPRGSSGNPAQHPARRLRRRRGLAGLRSALRAALQRVHRGHRIWSRRVLPRQFHRGLFELAHPAAVLEFAGVRPRDGGDHLRHGRAGGLGGRAHRRARRDPVSHARRCCRSPFPDC